MNGKALVAYATKHGGTAGIAETIATTLRGRGIETDVQNARDVRSLDGYRLVIIGSAVYMFRWQGDALDLLKRFDRELRAMPIWMFSSGPTGGDPKADAKLAEVLAEQPPAPGEAGKRAERLAVRGHATFGGRLDEGASGFFERWVPKGDWRDPAAIAAWANGIADTVAAEALQPA